MTVWEQTRVFTAMMLCGVCVGAAHDVLGMLRKGVVMTACMDLLLGMMMAAAIVCTALMLQCDAFRMYVFSGVAAGWLLYACTLGTVVRILKACVGKLSKKSLYEEKVLKRRRKMKEREEF